MPLRIRMSAWIWGLAGLVVVRADEPSRYVHVERGDLPIIISAPHGGTMPLPDVSPRDTSSDFSAAASLLSSVI